MKYICFRQKNETHYEFNEDVHGDEENSINNETLGVEVIGFCSIYLKDKEYQSGVELMTLFLPEVSDGKSVSEFLVKNNWPEIFEIEITKDQGGNRMYSAFTEEAETDKRIIKFKLSAISNIKEEVKAEITAFLLSENLHDNRT